MNLVIGNPTAPKYTSCFVLVTEWMHGDADAYTKEELKFGNNIFDTAGLLEEIELLERIKPMFKGGMGGDATYASEAKRTGVNLPEAFTDSIPCDQFSCEGDASLECYKVFWYDHNGVEHPVEVKETLLKPLLVEPQFIRDNQYKDKYVVISESVGKFNEDFLAAIKEYGEEYIVKFPSGLRCFFLEKQDRNF